MDALPPILDQIEEPIHDSLTTLTLRRVSRKSLVRSWCTCLGLWWSGDQVENENVLALQKR